MDRIFEDTHVAAALGVAEVTYLGTGSYGETWRAFRKGRDCAVKIIHRAGYNVERLDREIEGYRRVSHANVVTLYDAYRLTVDGTERVALEFEYIDGGDLAAAIKKGRPSPKELRGLAIGLLNGIEALHNANLLHRDLKPENIAVRNGSFEAPVILDLGLAKLLDIESITRYPARIGTALYMAPEQIRGLRARRTSDLWALGVILFEASTGQHPFFEEGESLTVDDAIARLTAGITIPRHIPEDVGNLILRCLSEPAYRRGTVAKALSRLNGEEF